MNLNRLENKIAGLAALLSSSLGAYGSPSDQMVLYLEDFEEAESLRAEYILLPPELREVLIEKYDNAPLPYLLDRPVIGRDWMAAVSDSLPHVPRFAFYGIKGGVGRSTALAMWALHLAEHGKRVLVLDIDLESPGSSGMLLNSDAYPDFGLVDWFVEDIVRQGYPKSASGFGTFFRPDQLYARSALADAYDGAVFVAPSYGFNNGSFITKLGRCYLDGVAEPWTKRLARFVDGLEYATECDVTLLDSRAGLHDIAAAATTRLGARTFLFAQDTRQTWASYAFLFSAWSMNLGRECLAERIYTVASMVPEDRHIQYIEDMRLHAWDCFRDGLYSAGGAGEDDYALDQAYDLEDESAPHAPVPIMWSQALRQFDPWSEIESNLAHGKHVSRFSRVLIPWWSQITSRNRSPLMAEQYYVPFNRDLLLEMANALPAVGHPEAGRLYVPVIHAKALNPDSDLVEGMRGAGKTFWCSALQNDALRSLLATNPDIGLAADTKVTVGYGESIGNSDTPDGDTLIQLVERQKVAPYILWKTVLFHQVADGFYPEEYAAFNTLPDSWNVRIQWVDSHPDHVAAIFRICDAILVNRSAHHIVLFDALDRTANDWQHMSEMLTGVLRVALFSRSYRRIRVKVFARPDQLAMTKMNAFTDASKIINNRFKLEWHPRELYGLLWQYLANGKAFGEYFRNVSYQYFGLKWQEVSPRFCLNYFEESAKDSTFTETAIFKGIARRIAWLGIRLRTMSSRPLRR